nr:MAG TPA: hypothetical protein [Caudoviricetes sp.]
MVYGVKNAHVTVKAVYSRVQLPTMRIYIIYEKIK